MNDEQLKREIEEALEVKPSPQFVARVRQHLAAEMQSSPIRVPWKALTVGFAAAVIAGGVALYRPQEGVVHKSVPNVRVAAVPLTIPEPKAPPAATPRTAARHHPKAPEVLIDPREGAALRSFLEDIDEQKIDPVKLQALFEAAEKARTIENIAPMPIAGLEPIVIRPLNSSSTDKEGGSL